MAKYWCTLMVLALAVFQANARTMPSGDTGLSEQKNVVGYGGIGGFSGIGANGLPFGGGGVGLGGGADFGGGGLGGLPGGGLGGLGGGGLGGLPGGGLGGLGGGTGTGVVPFP